IRDLVPDQDLLPMIKADAYGHGMEWVSSQLMSLPGLYGFGVATLEEGAELRTSLGARGRKIPIVVFSETSPFTDDLGAYCQQHALTPVIASESDWSLF